MKRRPPVFAPYLSAFLTTMTVLSGVGVIALWLGAIWADDPTSSRLGHTAFVCFVVGCVFGFGRVALYIQEYP